MFISEIFLFEIFFSIILASRIQGEQPVFNLFKLTNFIFVPDGALHQPINTGEKDLKLIVARNTPVEIVKEQSELGRKDC